MSTMTQAPEGHLHSTPPELAVVDVPVPDYATPGYGGTAPAPDFLLPELSSEPRWYRNLWLAVAVIVLALFARVVFGYFAGADNGVDQNAYLVGGRLLAQHFSMRYTLPNPYAYSGGMFIRMPDGTYFPKYPFGLPLLFACFFWAFKIASVLPILRAHVEASQAAYWAFIVSPVSAVVAVAGVFFLARQVSGSFAATLAAILLGTSQLMLMLADNPNSHAACLAFIVWGMFFCLRWMQTGSYWRGILGGLLVGYAATIRYNEVLLFIPMCVVVLSKLPWNQWKSWLSVSLAAAAAGAGFLIYAHLSNAQDLQSGLEPRWIIGDIRFSTLATTLLITLLILYSLAALVICVMKLQWPDWRMYMRALVPGLAWAVPVLILFAVNLKTMGSSTGYDSTHESEFGVAFQWQFFWRNWEKVLRDFCDMGLFFIVPFAVAGIFMLLRRSWRVSLLLLAWLVPGVVLYMSYYWSPDFADAYARFFLTYLPALLVGAAVCFHDGLLAGQRESGRWGGIALTISAGAVVAIAAGVSTYRTVHGLRDGAEAMRVPLNDFRQRLALAQTGQMLLDNVPEKSVLFADDTGGIATHANYIQFVRDWELYSADAFSVQGSRRGMGGPPRRNLNARGGARGNFNGPGGGPRGGGPAGFGGGRRGGGGNFVANNNANDPNDPNAIATPVQPEQQLYHAGLYKNKSSRQLYNLEAEVVNKAFAEHRRVFVVLAKDHSDETERTGGFSLWGGGDNEIPDPMTSFKEDLNEAGKYKYKTVSRWEDVALPEDREEDLSLTDNSPMGGGRGGMGMNVARMFMGNDRIMDWQLVEVLPR